MSNIDNAIVTTAVMQSCNALSTDCNAFSNKEVAEIILQPDRLKNDNLNVNLDFFYAKPFKEQRAMVIAVIKIRRKK